MQQVVKAGCKIVWRVTRSLWRWSRLWSCVSIVCAIGYLPVMLELRLPLLSFAIGSGQMFVSVRQRPVSGIPYGLLTYWGSDYRWWFDVNWSGESSPAFRLWYVDVPLWAISMALAICCAMICNNQQSLGDAERCHNCKYNITGLDRCPECGAPRLAVSNQFKCRQR